MKIDTAGIYENDGETPELADGLVVRSAQLRIGSYVWRTAQGTYYNVATRAEFTALDFSLDPDDLADGDIIKFEVAYGR